MAGKRCFHVLSTVGKVIGKNLWKYGGEINRVAQIEWILHERRVLFVAHAAGDRRVPDMGSTHFKTIKNFSLNQDRKTLMYISKKPISSNSK